MKITSLLTWLLGAVFLLSCSNKDDKKLPEGVGINTSYLDTTVRPSEDFFRFVNGGWIAKNEIPADLGAYGSFTELREENQKVLLEILRKAGENEQYKEGSDQRKAADFYTVGMDSLMAERAGVSILQPYFEKIDAIRNKKDLQEYLEQDILQGGSAFFNMAVFPDLKKSNVMAAYLTSGGIGLPERDYYLKEDDKSKETRQKYVEYIKNLFVLAGADEAEAKEHAETVLKIETRLAKTMLSKEDSRDPYKSYFPKSIAELNALAPSVDWRDYFQSLDIKVDTVIVTEPAFLQEYHKIASDPNLQDVKTYLRAGLLRSAAPFMNHAFVQESFNFNSKYRTYSLEAYSKQSDQYGNKT